MLRRPLIRSREVNQQRLGLIAKRQAEAHEVNYNLSIQIQDVLKDLMNGAVVEDGPLYFDPETKLVRTRKKEKKASGE